jgi:hypothetical protein
MSRLWRGFQRQPALFAAALLVIMNIIALSGVLHLSTQGLGGLNAAVAAGLALLVPLVISLQLSNVRRGYMVAARERPASVVPTAGSLIGEVVGRDDLCYSIIEDLRDPATRRPHVIIGGAGAGKTAVVVRLTKLLAEADKVPLRVRLGDAVRVRVSGGSAAAKVPVPVRLRDAQEGLDFHELARDRFLSDTDAALLSAADGERIWRQLRQDDKIVVLADGLEEALIEGGAWTDRDNLIRLAVERAQAQRLPLIITSRPHDPLRALNAVIVDLEPLSQEAALEYVLQGDPGEDEYRLQWIVDTADAVEAPLYLEITRRLNGVQLIQRRSLPGTRLRPLDTRGADRWELRLRLLQTWEWALVSGLLAREVALSSADRKATIEQLSLLALGGLLEDRLEINPNDLGTLLPQRAEPMAPVVQEVRRRLAEAGQRNFDIRIALTRGAQLGLVETRPDSVRFSNSIVQAYLGSRLLPFAMADASFSREALRHAGRELLMALVMRSRTVMGLPETRADVSTDVGSPPSEGSLSYLLRAARERVDVRALDIYATLLEIDSIDRAPAHQDIAREIVTYWERALARDPRMLEDAKLNLIRRLGEAARTISMRPRLGDVNTVPPAYRQLFEIGCFESSDSLRLAVVQEIGAGGDDALLALAGVLGSVMAVRPQPQDNKKRKAQTLDRRNKRRTYTPDAKGNEKEYGNSAETGPEEIRHRVNIMRGWLAPLLAGSATDPGSRAAARAELKQWVGYVHARDQAAPAGVGLSLEIALAQGFKYAANRRSGHSYGDPETRSYLIAQAREMLRNSHFWFSRLTLVQALALWHLPDGPDGQGADHGADAGYSALVAYWLGSANARREHPFVAETSRLVVRALETRQPERYIWIDESGIISHVGSRPAKPGSPRQHALWIPPSTGWCALDMRAQQLVADVFLLLNLAERADVRDRDRRLHLTNRDFLPPCLANDRTPLDPMRTISQATTSAPGTNCTRACPFELCPYPPKGTQPHWNELSEAFCRRQQMRVSGTVIGRNAAPPWSKASPANLRRFWQQMSQRG